MKNKTNKKIKWLALGATLALGSAFVVPAVLNESPVAIEETASAETTYTDVNMFDINVNFNNRSGNQILVTAQLNGTTQAIDRTQELGDFFTKATLEVNGTTKTLTEAGFALYAGTGDQHGGNYIWISYTAIADPAENAMHTVTVPAGTTLYNYKFASEYKFYYYNGWWNNDPIVKTTDEAYVLTDAAKVVIEPSLNHSDNGTQLLFYGYVENGIGGIALDYDYAVGNFWSNIKLNGEATDKFRLASINNAVGATGNSQSGQSSIDLRYVADAEFWKTTSESYHTLTIPANTTFYNIRFANEINLYFFNGQWQLTKPEIVEDREYSPVDGIAIVGGYNHITSANIGWNHNLLLQLTNGGTAVSMDKTVSQGNFFTNATIDINGTITSIKDSKFGFGSYEAVNHGATYYNMIYAPNNTWEDPAEGETYTVTIPEGTVVYNVQFSKEVKLYFFDGEWTTMEPVVGEDRVLVETARVGFEPTVNHVVLGNKMATVIYSYAEGKADATKLNFAYGQGSFNDNIYLTEYKDGQEGEQIKGKVWYTSGVHSQNGLSPIHLAYEQDSEFWASTTEKYYILTIPADTVLYNVIFQEETKIYFYDGKWITKQPLTADEMEFLEVDTFRINPAFNHTVWQNKNALILHAFSADDKQVSMVPNNVYPVGDFLSKVAVYDKDGNKLNVEVGLGLTMGHMGETSSAIHLTYPIDESFWTKTLDTYYELRIEEGAKLYNFVMAKTFSYYFYNGAWMESKPVVDYTVNLENLPTFTIGEIVEAKPGKFDTFVLGELGAENVVAGSFSSPILNAKEYKLNFGMKILSDEYRFVFSLNSSVSNVWGGLTLMFDRINGDAGYAQGVHYLDYLNVDGSFLGTGGDYYLTDKWFEPNVAYDVTITVALDPNDLGVLIMLTVDGEEWGRLFVPPTGDYTMEEAMDSGFMLSVDNGDGYYFGTVEFTNKDVNAPELNVKNAVIESDSVAENYAYEVEVIDLMDGEMEYTATLVSGELADGKFVANTEYVVRFEATDKAGNKLSKDVTFTVAYDVTAPVITVSDKVEDGTIEVTIGTTEAKIKQAIAAAANDNKDGKVEVTYVFPDGMFDENGKLTEGNFRVQITAKDSSDNEVTLTVRVRATEAKKSSKKEGCGGTVTLAASATVLAGVGVLLSRKKKED